MEPGPQREKHTRIIGAILTIFGSFMLLGSLFAYNIMEFIFNLELSDEVRHWDLGIFSIDDPYKFFYFIPIICAIYGALELGTGIGLLNKQAWAEKMSMVLACFMIFNVPIGTALAVYIFYTFINGSSKRNQSLQQQ